MTREPPKHGEATSRRIAEIAARGIRDPGSLSHAEIAAVCGSALTQFERPQPRQEDPANGRG